MSGKTYDILKYLQRIAIPAVLAFVLEILHLCGVSADCVRLVGSIGSATLALFGALMQREYNKWSDANTSAIENNFDDFEKGEE